MYGFAQSAKKMNITNTTIQISSTTTQSAAGIVGNTITNSVVQLNKLLKRKGIALNYADKIDMFSNYVIMYDMREITDQKYIFRKL